MDKIRIKIFTEGGKSIGLGHISRCAALHDEIISRGIHVDFIVDGDIRYIEFLKGKPIINDNWMDKCYLINNISHEDYVIVDSYKANREIYNIIALHSKGVLYIDDDGRLEYPKGIIVNPALDSSHISYSNSSKEALLTGSKYVILRSSFIGLERKFIQKDVNRVLIMMGGTDLRNMTPMIIDKLCKENPNIVFDIILGNLQFESKDENMNYKNVNYHVNLSEDEMSRIMLNSDLAITAAGQTIYELMATKTPFIAVEVIDNQKNNIFSISEYISSKVVLKYDDDCFIENLQKIFIDLQEIGFRKTLVEKMNNLIDGLGRKRIIDALLKEFDIDRIILRKVKEQDIEKVFELSNQEYVRRYSINKNRIQWTDHINWFKNILQDKNVVFHVVTDENESFLGQIRYNVNTQSAIVSISLSKKLRGKGLSKKVLDQSIEKLFKENQSVEVVIAFVSEENVASKKMFEGLNFQQVNIDIEDHMIKYILKRGMLC